MAQNGFRTEGGQKPPEEVLLVLFEEEIGISCFLPESNVVFVFLEGGDLLSQVPLKFIDVDPFVHRNLLPSTNERINPSREFLAWLPKQLFTPYHKKLSPH
jgi:hypothetical protein